MTRAERQSELVMMVYEKDVDHYISRYMTQTSQSNAIEMYTASFILEEKKAEENFGHANFNRQYMVVKENDNYTTRFRAVFYTRGDIIGNKS